MRKRTSDLIYFLQLNHRRQVHKDSIKSVFLYAESIFQSEIKEINHYLKLLNKPEIIYKNKIILIENIDDFTEIYQSILNLSTYEYILSAPERQDLIVALLCLNEDSMTMSEISDLFVVSRLTILRDLETIRLEKEIYHQCIVSLRGDGVKFEAPLMKKWLILISLLKKHMDLRGYVSYVANYILNKIYRTIDFSQLQSFFFHRLDYDKKYERFDLMLALYIIVNQTKQYPVIRSQSQDEYETIAQKITQQLVDYFEMPLLSRHQHTISSFLQSTDNHHEDNTDMLNILIHFLDRIDHDLNTMFKYDNVLIRDLYNHLSITQDYYFLVPLLHTTDVHYAQFDKVLKLVKKYAYLLQKYIAIEIKESFLYSIAIHLVSSLLKNQYFQYRINTWIVSMDLSTSKLLAMQLTKYSYLNVSNVTTYKALENTNVKEQDVDLLITADQIKFDFTPIIKVHFLLNQEDNTKILNFIRYYINQQHAVYDHEINSQNLDLTQIDRYLEKDMILYQHRTLTWQDAIQQAGAIMLHKQMIEQSYIDQVIKNVDEYGPYIVLGNHVALAHANNKNNVFESGMSLLVSDCPIYFENEDYFHVKYLFFVALIDSNEYFELLQEIMILVKNNLMPTYVQQRKQEETHAIH